MPDEGSAASRSARGLSRARRIGGRPAASAPAPVPPPDVPPPLAAAVARSSKAGRNLAAAIGVDLALGALILVSLFAYRPSFAVIVGVAATYGSDELRRAIATTKVHVALVPVLA